MTSKLLLAVTFLGAVSTIGCSNDTVVTEKSISVEPQPFIIGMTWVSINDSGAGMKDGEGNALSHGGFSGEMSKYETTNAQYCQFLNWALASGDVVVVDNYVRGSEGSNSGSDFVGEIYYDLSGTGYNSTGAVNGGAARINYIVGSFTVDSGFENHPVTFVSWYGSTAFCNYNGYRLPTEWEWQAVADYDGSFTYGCGTSIDKSIANYCESMHPDGTTVVGSFGSYGYGLSDMAGNVWERTESIHSDGYFVVRGGSWALTSAQCTIFPRFYANPEGTYRRIGFRVCR